MMNFNFFRYSGLLFLCLSQTLYAVDGKFRLSGIISINEEKKIALFEFEDGSNKLLYKGDHIEQYPILEITKHKVLIKDGDTNRWLNLSSDGEVINSDQTGQPGIEITQETDVYKLADSIKYTLVKIRQEKVQSALSEVLPPLLNLPKDSYISAINDIPLDNNKVESSLKLVEEILRNSDEMIRFSIKNNPETDAIYLMPSHLSN